MFLAALFILNLCEIKNVFRKDFPTFVLIGAKYNYGHSHSKLTSFSMRESSTKETIIRARGRGERISIANFPGPFSTVSPRAHNHFAFAHKVSSMSRVFPHINKQKSCCNNMAGNIYKINIRPAQRGSSSSNNKSRGGPTSWSFEWNTLGKAAWRRRFMNELSGPGTLASCEWHGLQG